MKSVRSIEEIGQKSYKNFVEECIKTGTKDLNDPIKKNKLQLFCNHYDENTKSRSDGQKKSLKNE